MPWGSWFDHLLDADKFIQENPQSKVHIVQFEKLKEDPVNSIKALCHFLGQPDEVAEQLAEETSFAKMKAAKEKAFGDTKDRLFVDNAPGTMVKGSVGSWREHFTVDQSERFDRVFAEKMAGSKLAECVKKYI